MTKNSHPTTEPVDEGWVAHVREVSTAVVPPTPANPYDMSRVAIRRTRTRRAVLVTGGGMTAVAAVAATAFALGGPTTAGVLLPGGSTATATSPSASADPSMSAEERRSREVQAAAVEALESAGVPEGWEVHELEGLTYALPPEIVTSGPVQDEPGVTSDMWHSGENPDAPPFFRIAYVTPDYEFYDTKSGGLTQMPGREAKPFDLPGATTATVEDGSSQELREIMAMPAAAGANEPVRIIVHRADGPGRYLITMNLPEGNDDLIEGFRDSLSLD